MKVRGYYELEVDNDKLLQMFPNPEVLTQVTTQMPGAVAEGVTRALAQAPGVKDVKVCPIPLMLASDLVAS